MNRADNPELLFTKIEEKQYTFPVLRGSEKQMSALEVYYYPTVIILNKQGQVVYRGKIENAEAMLKDLLN